MRLTLMTRRYTFLSSSGILHYYSFLQRSVAVIQDSDSVTYGSLVIKKKMETAMVHLDRKLIFIPLVFILLRIWGTLRFFISFMSSCHHRCGTEIVVINPCKRALYDRFLLTMHAIGDPAQGWGNAIIFALFNRTISRRLFPCVYFLGRKIRHCFTKHSAGDTQSFMHGIKDPLLHNSDEQM